MEIITRGVERPKDGYKVKQAPSHTLKSPLARQFKSPICRTKQKSSPSTPEEKAAQVEALQKKLAELKAQVEELEKQGFKESELQDHIDKLHEYNEIKDVGVMTLGRIAVIEGVQTKDLYEKYGLELTD